jgi:DNA-binding SARP family transcriptional activator
MLEIRLLGPPALTLDGVPFVLQASKRAFSLLAYLALHVSKANSRDVLAFALWPDQDEDAARATLRRHVHRLSKALPPAAVPWLATDGRRYVGLNRAAPLAVDVGAFEFAIESGDDARASEIYKGDLCTGFDDEWLDAPRERFRMLQIASLGRLAQSARADRRFDDAAAFLTRLLGFEPFDEETLRALMSVRNELGDRAGALATYERFSEQLKRELNIAPMQDTLVRYQAIRDGEPTAGASRSSRSPLESARHALPLLGRRAELARVDEMLRHPERGTRVLAVSGVAGIGKSRFAEVVALDAERTGMRVSIGTTSVPESRPYESIVRVLANLAPFLSKEGRENIAALSGPATTESAVFARSREQLFESVSRALEEASLTRPLLVVLEDLHWAGTSTLELVEHIARYDLAERCRFLLTMREDEAQGADALSLRRRLLSDDLGVAISLCPLNASEVEPLTGSASKPQLGMNAGELVARSGGNPFFIASLLELGSDAPTLEDSLRGRLLRLPAEAQEIATAAAVFGEAFDAERIGRLTGENEGSVFRALGPLLDARLVRDAGAGARYGFSFSHALIREAAYALLDEPTRRRRHARAAALTAEDAATDVGLAYEVAAHYRRANLSDEAARWYGKAADHAYSTYASQEALTLASEGIALTANRDARIALLLIRESAARRLGRVEEALSDLRELDALAGDDRETGWEIGLRRVFLGNFKYDVEIAETGLRALERFGDTPARRATALDMRAQIEAGRERPENAIAGFRDASALYETLGDARSQLRCDIWLFQQNALLDRYADIARARAEVVARSEAFGNDGLLLFTGGIVCGAGSLTTDDRMMLELSNSFIATAERLRSNWYLGFALDSLAERLCYAKRTCEADHVLERARAFWMTGGSGTSGLWEQRKMQVDVQAGRYADAFRRGELCDKLLPEIDRPLAMYLTSLHRLDAALESEDIDAAQRYVLEFRSRLEAVTYTLYRLLALLSELRFCFFVRDWAGTLEAAKAIAANFGHDSRRYRRLVLGSAPFRVLAALELGDVNEAAGAAADIEASFDAALADGYADGAIGAYAVARAYRSRNLPAEAGLWLAMAHRSLEAESAAFGDPEAEAAYRRRPIIRDITVPST